MDSLNVLMSPERHMYDGSQLRPHWLYETFNLLGHSVAGFVGPADVPLAHMVDLEDVKKEAPIASSLMLHFIGEWFIDSLETGILLQHLFIAEIYENLLEKGIGSLRRSGNDIYYESRKLSVSICTRSPVSVLMHSALNVETTATPIPTSGLSELGLEPMAFGKEILDRFQGDSQIWRIARVKVRSR